MSTATPTEGTTATFADLGVDQVFCDAIAADGIVNAFPIQEITLPLALSGADVIGQARTGTGKTLAFGLPLLQRVEPGERRTVALVIVPTRELCLQVRDDLARAAGRKEVEVLAVYGGRAIEPQMDALRAGAPVVVGTPGRLLDLKQRGSLDLSGVTALVLDEADEMLDLGFLPDVERLIEATSPERQTMLFSATMPSAVVALARRYMSKPTFLRADVEESHIGPDTRQHFFSCHRMDKPAVLARILQAPERGLCVVFTRTKRMADILASELRDRGIDASPIHSDLRQESRERALKRFREGKIDVLVATEVAARGLDIDDVTHVVNYDTPDDEKMYLHRIGRTGRAGAAGVAITLAVWNELARVEMIKRALDIDEPTHEVFSTSEILDDLFDLPPRESRQQPSAKDWERAVKRGRRPKGADAGPADDAARPSGGGRRSSRRADKGEDRKVPARDIGEAAAAVEEAANSQATRHRVRRRARGGDERGEGGARGAPEAAPVVEQRAEESAGEPAAESAGERGTRRVRRRSGRAATDDRKAAGDRADSPAKARSGASGDGRQPGGAQRGNDRAARGSSGSGSGRSEGRSEGRSAGDGQRSERSSRRGSQGNARRSTDRRGRSESGRSAGSATRTPTRQVNASEARGSGQPRLRRPLEVVHLP
jgi:superfamily II DNA/RNA helicase